MSIERRRGMWATYGAYAVLGTTLSAAVVATVLNVREGLALPTLAVVIAALP